MLELLRCRLPKTLLTLQDADYSRAPGLTSGLQWSVNAHRGSLLLVPHSDSASVLLYFIFLSHLFPLPSRTGSTVPREWFDSRVIMPFSGVLWLWHFIYSVCPLPVSNRHIYTLLLCRGHSWRVRLAKQETLTTPGQLVSTLVCRGPWMSTVVLYCWCHSDSASVLLYFTFFCILHYTQSEAYTQHYHNVICEHK